MGKETQRNDPFSQLSKGQKYTQQFLDSFCQSGVVFPLVILPDG